MWHSASGRWNGRVLQFKRNSVQSLLLKIFSAMEMAMINWASTGHSVFLFSSKMLAGRHHDKIIYDKVKKQKLMVAWNWRFQCGQFIELMACEVTCAHYCHVKEGDLFTSNSALSLSSYVVTGDQGGDSQAPPYWGDWADQPTNQTHYMLPPYQTSMYQKHPTIMYLSLRILCCCTIS